MKAETERTSTTNTYGSLLELIRSGKFTAGDKLPNEREIAKRFATGRGVVRDAMLRLQSEGLIERKVGSGTYLSPEASSLIEMKDAGVNLSRNFDHTFYDMIEARLHFEPEVAATAASMNDKSGVAKLGRKLERINEARNWLEFKESIYAFHRGVYVIANNHFLLSVFDNIHRARRSANYDGRNLKAKVAELIRKQTTEDLRPIHRAIADGDGDKAAELIRGYLFRILAGR